MKRKPVPSYDFSLPPGHVPVVHLNTFLRSTHQNCRPPYPCIWCLFLRFFLGYICVVPFQYFDGICCVNLDTSAHPYVIPVDLSLVKRAILFFVVFTIVDIDCFVIHVDIFFTPNFFPQVPLLQTICGSFKGYLSIIVSRNIVGFL